MRVRHGVSGHLPPSGVSGSPRYNVAVVIISIKRRSMRINILGKIWIDSSFLARLLVLIRCDFGAGTKNLFYSLDYRLENASISSFLFYQERSRLFQHL